MNTNEEQKTIITICHDYETPIKILKFNLELNDYTILDDNILDIDNNRQIDVQAYFQLKKRSPNNPYIYFLHSKMIEKKLEEITDSDVILFYNVNDGKMSQLMFFYLALSWQMVKKIYLWLPINKHLPFYNEIFSLEIPNINANIKNIVPPVKGNAYINPIKETKNLVIETSIITSKTQSIERRDTPIKTKKLIKKKIIGSEKNDENEAPF